MYGKGNPNPLKFNNKGGQIRFYNMWYNMRKRCNDKNTKYYKNYGGRGITYNKKWNNYKEFALDIYLKYCKAKLSINKPELDRIENNKGYFINNIRFVTHKNNNRNKRTNNIYKGKPLVYWIEKSGIKNSTIRNRISRGWSIKKALSKNPRIELDIKES